MLEILKYIFSSPLTFIGTLILIYAIGEVIGDIVSNICKTIIISRRIKDLEKTDIKIE